MILAVLQARISSSRLPGKTLKAVLGEPMLLRQIERIQRSRRIDHLLVATSSDVSDDVIEQLCESHGIDCFRGDLQDVLDRFYQAAIQIMPEHIVRLTGDCPLCDPELMDEVIEFHLSHQFDYTSNTIKPTYPDGLDVEVFRFACLKQAWEEAKLPSQREHVTPFIHQQSHRYKIGSFMNKTNLSHLRWTVDELPDFRFISEIYQELYPATPLFTTQDILNLLKDRPELLSYNQNYKRNEGYQKSLKEDGI